ncbi:hypothetical protein AX16_000825 [Volvariella volvacea WC 439]|nr:hypothetical protein AX16_000825 [Volvariella volvacea WC 439]
MDFITDLPKSRGFNALLVVIDHGSTKGMIINPCWKDITTEETVARKEATAAHELARIKMMKWNTTKYIPFRVGEQVWLEAKNIKTHRVSKKLAPKREGPFKVVKVLGPVTFQLELPEQWKIHNVFHALLLTPYKENDMHGPNFLMPPLDIINDEEEWEVENIIKHRWIGQKKKQQIEYLIAWKEYPSSENQWEKENLLTNAPEILKEYKRRHNIIISEASSPPFSSDKQPHQQPRSSRHHHYPDPQLDPGKPHQSGADPKPLCRSTHTRRSPSHCSLHLTHVEQNHGQPPRRFI